MKKIISLFIVTGLAINIMAQTADIKPAGLKLGDQAPGFTTKDKEGKEIDLKNLLKRGDVVLIFYRGQWCPYCNKQLQKVNDSLSLITAKGASVIAITPETAENIAKTIEKTKASFPIVEDKNLSIMKAYKVNFAVDKATVEKYKGYGIDFAKANGDNGENLPVPATYIIGKDGKIKYVFFDEDYRKRPSVKELLEKL